MMQALQEAARLHHASAGVPHIVLALLDETRPSTARDVLQSLGLDRRRAESTAEQMYEAVEDSTAGPRTATSEPLWHETLGFAEGFAAGIGRSRANADDILLALVWQARTRSIEEALVLLGTDRQAVFERLVAHGADVPPGELPVVPRPMQQAARFPSRCLDDLVDVLRQRVPLGQWGVHGDRSEPTMVLLASNDVDIREVLDGVVGTGEWSRVP